MGLGTGGKVEYSWQKAAEPPACTGDSASVPGAEYKQQPLTRRTGEEGKSIHLRDMNCKQSREFNEGGNMTVLVFANLQEQKYTLIVTPPQRELTTQLEK